MNLKKIYKKNKISLYPYIESKNIFLCLCNAFQKENNEYYKILYKSENLIHYPRSTLSLLRIYQYLNIYKNKRTIYIPDYICNASLSLLRGTDAKIIFYDHSLIKNKNLISELKTNEVDIFLFVNYFGKRSRINSDLLEFINRKKITLIEDNTHCLTSFENSCSDIEIYSPHKLFGIEDGSIIKFRDISQYKHFKNFKLKKKNIYKDLKLIRIIDFITIFIKRKIRKFFGYKYPELNFADPNNLPYKINYDVGLFSRLLLNSDSKKIDLIRKKRFSNYYSWKNNLNLILPFLKMEKIDYIPYLGIVDFINTKERTKILKQYNLYGLPFGNWPDLPPEVIKSKKNHNEAIRKFENQITLPVHQDLHNETIDKCIEKCFDKYIDSFKLVYFLQKKEIKIQDNGKSIGRFLIFYDSKNNQSILELKIYKNFYSTYNNSRQFFYKFGETIIKRFSIKKKCNLSSNLVLKLH